SPTAASAPLPMGKVECCPKCGGDVRNWPGRSWCMKCGWDSTAEETSEEPPAPQFSWKLPSWAITLLVGCAVIILFTNVRGMFLGRGSWIFLSWILIEGVAGIVLYFVGHFWLLAVILRYMRESELIKYLDPTYVWRHAIEHLPHTRGAMILG